MHFFPLLIPAPLSTVTMSTFEYVANSPQVIFGKGTLAQLPSLVEKLGIKSVMILSTPEQTDIAQRVAEILGTVAISTFSGATMHTPIHVTESALSQAKESRVAGIVSVGGGSTIGLGKAIGVRTGLVHICIPTTYAGSEMTPILGETEDGRKVTRRDSKILPTAVIYDVDLTLTLPVKMSVNSGINAIAHSSSCPHLPSAVQAVFPDVFLTIPDYFSRGTLR
jgi:alcohol dehydrogenase class IV